MQLVLGDRAPRPISVDTVPMLGAGAMLVAVAAALPALPGHDVVTCPLRATTGVPCPFCGMTRGIGRLVGGDVGGAVALNPGSVLLVLAVVALVVALVARRTTIRIPAWAPLLALASMWAFELAKYATGRPL